MEPTYSVKLIPEALHQTHVFLWQENCPGRLDVRPLNSAPWWVACATAFFIHIWNNHWFNIRGHVHKALALTESFHASLLLLLRFCFFFFFKDTKILLHRQIQLLWRYPFVLLFYVFLMRQPTSQIQKFSCTDRFCCSNRILPCFSSASSSVSQPTSQIRRFSCTDRFSCSNRILSCFSSDPSLWGSQLHRYVMKILLH